MKKLLYILGFGALGSALYLYFKNQLSLALSYDYKIANWKILNLTDKEADLQITILLENKSAFEIEVDQYQLDIYYKNILIAKASSVEMVKILSNSSIPITTAGSIVFSDAAPALVPLVTDVLNQRPIQIQVSGFVKVKFMGLDYTINLDKDVFQLSNDLLTQYGLTDKWNNFKSKLHF